MTTETLEELRYRLLRQERVQEMIQVRAYEIYQMRGCTPGGEAHDWFHAEAEVLAFLLADESTQNNQQPEPLSGVSTSAPSSPPVARKAKRTSAKSAEAKSKTPKKPTAKRASPKKPAGSKSGAARTSRKSKTDES